ncbi:iron-containing alcohol dehydrogenase [Bacillus norwichensis]|uniref:Iron-containing alcohol dehydrogenase n=1 Tax=Bacillus norwichensis TaxID=2762217 RepID=A0ABR8VQZ2_9BACI|nr:iron-containing alcohol dehydrogenase [Bacillus norwichensis]MBD8007204.1 iron-containing alcohol dehydrogenase [Bacillus norwichensis]
MLWNFKFNVPTSIEFGNGKVKLVGEFAKKLGGQKVLIVTDKGLANTGILDKVIDPLKEKNIDFLVYDEVKPNPRDVDCQKAYEQVKEEGIDVLIGLGGGSSMDTAKAIGTLLTHGGTLSERYGTDKLERDITPLICIPTTAGTGSEVTSYSVITDTNIKDKMLLFDLRLSPKVALVDPELTLSLPKSITAATGMDALTHAIEAYVCNVSEPISDSLALHAIELIAEHLVNAVENGKDLEARQNMIVASLIAGLSFANTNLGSVHAMAEPLGGLYDTPHGVANAIFLPFVFKFNISSNPKKFANVAKKLGVSSEGKTDDQIALEGAKLLEELANKINIPKFSDLDYVDTKDFDFLAGAAEENICTTVNPRKITKEDYIELFTAAYEYKGSNIYA